MNKIALSMIVKGTDDESEKLAQALDSIYKHVDAIFITITGDHTDLNVQATERVAERYKVHLSYTDAILTVEKKHVDWLTEFFGYEPHMREKDKIFLFDKARNYNLSQIPQDQYPWIVWIDTDDIFRGGEKLRELAERGIKENIQAFYMRYIYKADIRDGKVHEIIIEHERERLVRNNGNFKWIAPIHETFIEQVPVRKEAIEVCDVLHFIEDKHMQDSLTRNLKNLELAIYQTEGKDPRHIYYLAKAYFDIVIQKGNNEYINKTIPLINMYLNGEHKSGWPGERAQAYLYLSEIYRRKGELNNTIKSLMNALIE